MEQAMIVWTNLPDAALAAALAQTLVEQKLAACVNVMPAVQSTYRWQEKIEHAEEFPLMIKCSAQRYTELEAAILAVHPFDVPEIIALPVVAGLPAYLNWIAAQTRKEWHV